MGGLLRGMARTAVIAGTATAVSNNVSRRQAGRWAAQEQQHAQQVPPRQSSAPPPPQEAPPRTSMEDKLHHLKALAALKEQGVLTDAEFDAQKQRILND